MTAENLEHDRLWTCRSVFKFVVLNPTNRCRENRFKEMKRRGMSRTGKTKSFWQVLLRLGSLRSPKNVWLEFALNLLFKSATRDSVEFPKFFQLPNEGLTGFFKFRLVIFNRFECSLVFFSSHLCSIFSPFQKICEIPKIIIMTQYIPTSPITKTTRKTFWTSSTHQLQDFIQPLKVDCTPPLQLETSCTICSNFWNLAVFFFDIFQLTSASFN